MDPIGHKLLQIAKSQLGYAEKAGGYTKYGDWYGKHVGQEAAFQNAPWCDMFLAWAADKAGVGDQAGEFASTPEHAVWFAHHGAWGHRPEPGAFAFYSFSGGTSIADIEHVGLVEKVDGRTLFTIEANHNNHLGRAIRDVSQVVGYGYPSKVQVADTPANRYVPRHSAPAPSAEQIAEQNRPGEHAQTTTAHEPLLPEQESALTGVLTVVLAGTVALAVGRSKVRVPNVRMRRRGKHHRRPVALPADIGVADLEAAEAGTELMPTLSAAAAAAAEDTEFWGKISELEDDEEMTFWDGMHAALSKSLPEILGS